uniref:Phospholipase A2 inhibitor gamma subunit B-like n=1 Tax=Pogona vitticeps TaxID=103695 RepID=A0ABM5ESB8_9SAUR
MVPLINLGLLLAGFLARGSCLICDTCISPGQRCDGVAHSCGPREDACLTIVGMNSLSGSDTTKTLKTCIGAADCYAGSISITTNAGLHLESISSCCQYDHCNRWDLNCGPPSKFTAQGCSTESACSLPLQTGLYSAGVIFNLDQVECSLPRKVSSG